MDPSKGIKSTEFWMFALTGVFLLVNGTPYINVPPDQVMAWLAATGLYAGLRTTEKSIALKQNAGALNPGEPVK